MHVQGGDAPVKHFDRTSNLNGTQIISYRASADGKWSTLVGIAPGSGEKCVTRGTRRVMYNQCSLYGTMCCKHHCGGESLQTEHPTPRDLQACKLMS